MQSHFCNLLTLLVVIAVSREIITTPQENLFYIFASRLFAWPILSRYIQCVTKSVN
jgi:hypothetical protein